MNQFKLYFQNGISIYSGKVIETKPHTHHATEIIYGLEGNFKVADAFNDEREYRMSIIPHDIKHRFINTSSITPIFIYLDPFHYLSQQLARSYSLDKVIVGVDNLPRSSTMNDIRSWALGSNVDIIAPITQLIHDLTGYASHTINLDDRIVESTEHIKAALHGGISLTDMAEKVHLSESRYAHLFKEQVGIPFRRFVLWTRLQATIEAIMNGKSLTSACYVGGFADLPHFSKTFTYMFGVSPSSVLKG